MTPVKQLYLHDPANGQLGDCFRTALACLLDLEPEEVPHFFATTKQYKTGIKKSNEWLANRGLYLISIPYLNEDVQAILDTIGGINPGLHYILTGESRTGVNHNVICLNNKVVWDPSLTNAGIIGPCKPDGMFWVDFLGRKI